MTPGGLLGRIILALWLVLAAQLPVIAQSPGPEPPRLQVDVPPLTAGGRTVTVPAGGDLQAALDAAQPGDTIVLEAGATCMGPFTLPLKTGAGWITIRSGRLEGLPPSGTRVGLPHAELMPKLVSRSGSVITAGRGAHHYRFVGLEIRPAPGVYLYNLVLLGDGERTADQLPHHLIFDRCHLRGDPKAGTRRGIAMNGAHVAVVDSYLADFKEAGADSPAIGGWNAPGPFKIVKGAGENVMFGGDTPAIRDLVPSDIEIRGNHFTKPLAWKTERWTVKNLFELKNAGRVLIDGNVFEHSWVAGQTGFAIVLTVRTEDGRAPWATIEDVAFTNNVVRHAEGGINLLGRDDAALSRPASRILVRNNLFVDINSRLFQLLPGAKDIIIEHNTALVRGAITVAEGEPFPAHRLPEQLVAFGKYGILGSGTASGLDTLNRYFPGSTVVGHVFFGDDAESHSRVYPGGNTFVTLSGVGFVAPSSDDWRLRPDSRVRRRGSEGKPVGVDFAELTAALGPASATLSRRQP